MPNNGIMKEIRSLLDQDKSNAEIIALGFKPATVHKVQRQWRQENPNSEPAPPQDMTAVLAASSDPQAWPEPEEEALAERHSVEADRLMEAGLEEQATEIASLQEQLAQTSERVAQLETEAGEVEALRERAAALEPMADSADLWQRKHQDLEERLGQSVSAMGQEVQDWQGKFTEEQKARKEAESLAERHSAEADRLMEAGLEEQAIEIASLQEQLAQTSERVAQLETEAGEVEALRERAAALEPMAASADMWQRKHQDLEEHLGHTVAAMGQEIQDWQGKFTEEQKARKETEALAERHSAEADRLMEAGLGEQAAEIASLQDQLAQTSERIAQLETEAGEVPAWRERATALEPMAASADLWQRKYNDLEDRLGHTFAAMGQEVQEWQGKFTEEHMARKEAETLAERHSAEADRLMEANRELQQKLQNLPNRLAQELWELVQPLNDELEELRPLKVWSGHTCAPQ